MFGIETLTGPVYSAAVVGLVLVGVRGKYQYVQLIEQYAN